MFTSPFLALEKLANEAIKYAVELNNCAATPEHLLYALARNEAFCGSRTLRMLEVNLEELAFFLEENLRRERRPLNISSERLRLSMQAQSVIANAETYAVKKFHSSYVGSEHVLFALTERTNPTYSSLRKFKVFQIDVEREIRNLGKPEKRREFAGIETLGED